MTDQRSTPTNLRSLTTRIDNLARATGQPMRRVQRAIANTVVAQMLPPGVIKGGTAMKLRVGEAASRFTADFDAARAVNIELDTYLGELTDRLSVGWAGFTGTVEDLEPAEPIGVPGEYVMQPFNLRLSYMERHWLSVTFELGRDEVGSTENPDLRIADDLVELFAQLGLPTPSPVAVLAVDHQIAQKLHACTSISRRAGGNERAHDLVDLQILCQEGNLDLAAVARTGVRLFAARHSQTWPPTVVVHQDWPTIYAEAAQGLAVLTDVAEAVDWANELIRRANLA